jgi:hypothetical protein
MRKRAKFACPSRGLSLTIRMKRLPYGLCRWYARPLPGLDGQPWL